MKKLSMVMAVVMLFVSCLYVTADTTGNRLKVTAAVSQEVKTGQQFTLSVDFSENTGFNTLGVKLTYPEGFAYVEDSAVASDLIKEECYLNFGDYSGETYTFYADTSARTITFIGASLYDITEANGTLFTAEFIAPEAAKSGAEFSVEIVDEPYSEGGDTVTGETEDGSVNVIGPYKLGDVKMDRTVDVRDALLTLRYSSGITTLNEQQLALANVHNGSTTGVDVRDALMILRYSSGIITEF